MAKQQQEEEEGLDAEPVASTSQLADRRLETANNLQEEDEDDEEPELDSDEYDEGDQDFEELVSRSAPCKGVSDD